MIESTRAYNEWGLLLWQLNEIWPTGGWGSIEYGASNAAGQVTGGRWKPLHHLLESTMFRDVVASCEISGRCYIRNDGMEPFRGKVELTLRRFQDGEVMFSREEIVTLSAGPAELQWFCLRSKATSSSVNIRSIDILSDETCATVRETLVSVGCSANGADCMLFLKSIEGLPGGLHFKGNEYSMNEMILAFPKSLDLPETTVSVAVQAGVDVMFYVVVTAEGGMAVATTLTSECPGRFDANTFALLPGVESARSIRFLPFVEAANVCSLDGFRASLRVEHLQQYL